MSLANLYASVRTGRADDGLVKIVVPGRRLIWLWIPKNAGGSISRTMVKVHGEDAVPVDLPFERLWRLNSDLKSFRIVAIKRNPYTRIVSCWLNKIANPEVFNPRWHRKYGGSLEPGMSFPDFAAWLNTHHGLDEKADPHWASQHRQLERATEIVAFEDLPDAVTTLGIDPSELLHENRHAHAAKRAGLDDRPLLSWYDQATVQQITERYAEDLTQLGYGMPEELRALVRPGAAPAHGMRAVGA